MPCRLMSYFQSETGGQWGQWGPHSKIGSLNSRDRQGEQSSLSCRTFDFENGFKQLDLAGFLTIFTNHLQEAEGGRRRGGGGRGLAY